MKIENIITSANRTESAYNAFYSKEGPYPCHLWTFGEHGVIHNAQTIKNKLDNCRETFIFVGYAEDHASNVYQMFNLQTKNILITHDIKWVKLSNDSETAKLVPLRVLED